MFKQFDSFVYDFGDAVVGRAKKNLNTSGFAGQKNNRKKNTTGGLSDSLYYKIIETDGKFIIEFLSHKNYAAVVEEGRKKGSYTPIEPLMQWLRNKKTLRLGVNKINKFGQKVRVTKPKTEQNLRSSAIAISKSNFKTGIKAVPFFGDALDTEFDAMANEMQEAFTQSFYDLTFDSFEKNKFKVTGK